MRNSLAATGSIIFVAFSLTALGGAAQAAVDPGHDTGRIVTDSRAELRQSVLPPYGPEGRLLEIRGRRALGTKFACAVRRDGYGLGARLELMVTTGRAVRRAKTIIDRAGLGEIATVAVTSPRWAEVKIHSLIEILSAGAPEGVRVSRRSNLGLVVPVTAGGCTPITIETPDDPWQVQGAPPGPDSPQYTWALRQTEIYGPDRVSAVKGPLITVMRS